jgi:hypothetical protein
MRPVHRIAYLTIAVVLSGIIANGQTNTTVLDDIHVKTVTDPSGSISMTFTDKDGKSLGTGSITKDALGNITTVLKDAEGIVFKREVTPPSRSLYQRYSSDDEADDDTGTTSFWPQTRRSEQKKATDPFSLNSIQPLPSLQLQRQPSLWETDDEPDLGALPKLPALPSLPSLTDKTETESPRGRYLGQLGGNRFDPDSTSNPFGAGNQFNPNSVKNDFGPYGNPFSPNSARNPYAIDTPRLYDGQGNYRGKLSSNPLDPDSVSNPFGRYGNRFSPDSVNNPFGAGNPFSPSSPNNPFGQGLSIYGDK